MTRAEATIELHQLANLLVSARCDLSNEKATQADIQKMLRGAGRDFVREARLGPRDIPDFLVGEAIVIEVKLRSSSRRNIGRQLARYAAYPSVAGILLVSNIAMHLPLEIEGKPALTVSLGSAWL